MLHLLALLGCYGVSQAGTPAPPRMPSGSVVVRECYGGNKDSRSNYGYPPPPPASPAPMGTGGYGSGSGVGTRSSTPLPAQAAATTPPSSGGSVALAEDEEDDFSYDASSSARRSSSGGGKSFADEGDYDKAPAKTAKVAEAKPKREDPPRDRAPAEPMTETAARPQPNLDWGATVYLSNDDSMSLASAQRLLYAIQTKAPVSTAQVRPHELLNYFSFETDPVRSGDTFSVRGSAEQTAPDVLTFAFAVKGMMPERKPLDLTMVLDRSGSMSAEGRMEYLKRGLVKMTDQLVSGDRVDLVLFDDQVCTPLENYVVGRDDPRLLSDAIARLAPRGSTDVDLGLKEGYRIASTRDAESVGRNRRMMLISDALLNTGDINPNTVTEVAKAYEEDGIRLTAVGVGRDFNDKVLDMLTEKGKGAYVYLGSEAVVDRVFGIGFPSLVQTIAHDVRFALDLPPSLAMKKFYGEESSTVKEDVQPIHYYAGTTQLFLQDLQLRGRPVASDPVTLTIEWKDVDTGRDRTQSFTTSVGALLESDPRNMRKGRALMAWTDLVLARTMGADPCGAPFDTWQERVDAVGQDAELQWLDGLTSPLCGARPVTPKPAPRGVSFKVKVDSDLPIAEVGLTCAGRTQTEPLSGSDSVARFAAASPGGCTLTLQGNVPMNTQVDVPSTGGEVRCMVRGGRMSCG